MPFNDVMELLERGVVFSLGKDLAAGATSEILTNRNIIALFMLHAAASNYPVDAPRCVDMAFKLADSYIKKVNEPTVVPPPPEEEQPA